MFHFLIQVNPPSLQQTFYRDQFAKLTLERESKKFVWSDDRENSTLLISFCFLALSRNGRMLNPVNTVDDLAYRPHFLPKIMNNERVVTVCIIISKHIPIHRLFFQITG